MCPGGALCWLPPVGREADYRGFMCTSMKTAAARRATFRPVRGEKSFALQRNEYCSSHLLFPPFLTLPLLFFLTLHPSRASFPPAMGQQLRIRVKRKARIRRQKRLKERARAAAK